MKRIFFVLLWTLSLTPLFAGITTYTFTSAKWASTPSGWTSNKDASDYGAGRTYTDGSLHMAGASVKTGSTGAGATSTDVFTDVRRVTINFCQNSSKGKGVIHVQVGSNPERTITVHKPNSGQGDLNRDSMILYTTPQTGKIKFRVECTENAINIHSISIRSAAGGSSSFTMDTYQLVTDINQIKDSDQVIFGVHKAGVNYIMGYFDEWESVNNIHAIKGKYTTDRASVDPDDRAIYTLRIAELNGKTAYIFQDEIRYEEAYLVASGGKTKNRLAVWDDVVDTKTYGNYGFWDIAFESGEAVITNLGNSLSKIIQYNASDNIFACYKDRSQTPVCLYRRTSAIGDVAAIVAPMVNFGTTIEQNGKRIITVDANKLTQDISAQLVKGDVFQLSASTIDRDGDMLTISYEAVATAGHYVDTLVLRSGETESRTAIVLNRINPMTIQEVAQAEDYTVVYLKDVVVTKKFDHYIYVRDATGSMLIFDRVDGQTGKRYGAKLNNSGDSISGVTGRFINYFGVPEISPSEQFKIGKNTEIEPEKAPAVIDSADVCRYLVLDSAVVESWTELTYKGKKYAVQNKFNLPSFTKDIPTRTYAVVSYDYDVVTLYIIQQETYPEPEPEDPDDPDTPDPEDPDQPDPENPDQPDPENPDTPGDQALDETPVVGRARLILHEGVVLVQTAEGVYTLQGEKIL